MSLSGLTLTTGIIILPLCVFKKYEPNKFVLLVIFKQIFNFGLISSLEQIVKFLEQ